MEEKKGLLSALAETLKQYELNQADDKESMAIALEEKLDEIAKMISSLSDRIDNLSSRVNHIGEKVDILENRTAEPAQTTEEDLQTPEPVFDEEKAEEEVLISGTAEPVFDSAEVDDNFHNADDEDYEDLDDEMEEEGEIEEVEEGEIEEEAQGAPDRHRHGTGAFKDQGGQAHAPAERRIPLCESAWNEYVRLSI